LKQVNLGQKGSSSHALSTLINDSRSAWAALGGHLLERGAHHIALLPTQPAQPRIAKALFVPGLHRHLTKCSKTAVGGIEAVERRGFDEVGLLLEGALPDALVFTDDWAARGGLQALAAAGVRYPRDILVATLANRGFVPVGACSFTRIEADPAWHGEIDANHVLFALGLTREVPPTTIGATLIIGASTVR
jgi:DNA-binding LacI/PurR family transcriptional regulator